MSGTDNRKILKEKMWHIGVEKNCKYKYEKWQIEKKEQQHLIRDKGRTNNKIKNQPDSYIYI